MKNYPHILQKVFSEPWVIRPERHFAIQQLLHSKLQGGDTDEDLFEAFEPEMSVEGKTAIIPVHGVIGKHLSLIERICGGCDIDDLNVMFDSAQEDEDITRIVMDYRTPGGTVTGIPELARKIANSRKEVLAFTDADCCSGGYWLASQAKGFYATESADVGSVGVYLAILDLSRQMANDGINMQTVSAGKYKLTGAYWKPLSDDERQMLQRQVDGIKAKFDAAVTRNREVMPDGLNAAVYDGEEAVRLGLVDGLVDDISDVIDRVGR